MDYTVQELIHNQSFCRLVKGKATEEEVKEWNAWIEASDEHRRIAKQATEEIVGFEFKDPKFPNIAKEWNRLREETVERKEAKKYDNHQVGITRKWMSRAAAILLLVGLAGLGAYIYSQKKGLLPKVEQIAQTRTVKTGPHDRKKIAFSDGAKIILNSRSSITYQVNSSPHQARKVVLHGEAYFEAVEGQSEFAVHTPDGIIRDIGTKFLVTVGKDHSRVVLQAGKVEVNIEDQKITMKKGELLSFDRTRILNRKTVNPSYYTSWATGFVKFHDTSLKEFANFVEKKFSVDVKITNSKVASIKISGSIYFKSLKGLIKSVSKVAMISNHQSKNGETIYLGNKHNEKNSSHE